MQNLDFYREAFESYLKASTAAKEPLGLYEPMAYILGLGGKRLRPSLTLLTSELFGGDFHSALDAALAVEIFHNFSLVHDDIMDDAPLRRGKTTVHEKWDINTGILSGDVMLIRAYQCLESYKGDIFKELLKLFSRTAVEVCEGQQYDVDFENRNDVTITEYLKMITFKTAVLIAAAMKMGAIIAKASKEDSANIYEFGRNLGIAFQLQDDYLDTFGDPETFGKRIGGDIVENKKTFLYLKSLALAEESDARELEGLFTQTPTDPTEKIERTREIYMSSGAAQHARDEIQNYTTNAFKILDEMQVSENNKKAFKQIGEKLMQRKV
ncbi:polyprenyl synthetase family protein [Poritiphilus flavus]|uniref:Polyprenyl synthetase family protein n=1 Tax=Poritiphilus flavus TaxID=2697053 RepID=A0A6L9E851_9FLAO|nr:polyprenyl synthetase family protein [Poritiphilus flavus]NAS10783.1 polyprenyl synthetase family protein [Poritiphilus flavus]